MVALAAVVAAAVAVAPSLRRPVVPDEPEGGGDLYVTNKKVIERSS